MSGEEVGNYSQEAVFQEKGSGSVNSFGLQ